MQNKFYILLPILETVWYTFSNTAQRYIRHNEYAMLHYDDICKIHELLQITKLYFIACPPWFYMCILIPKDGQNMTEPCSLHY
jgi:hypothetical protein